MAQITNITAGTTMDTRHATFGSNPAPTIRLKSSDIMKICVTPPPRLPSPAAVALAVPTTLGANMSEHQNWLVTKVAPAQPMKNLVRCHTHMHTPLHLGVRRKGGLSRLVPRALFYIPLVTAKCHIALSRICTSQTSHVLK